MLTTDSCASDSFPAADLPRSGAGRTRRMFTVALAVAGLLVLSGCGSKPPTSYTDGTHTAFVSGCTAPGIDGAKISSDVCECSWAAITGASWHGYKKNTAVPFKDFKKVIDNNTEHPNSTYPQWLLDIVAKCKANPLGTTTTAPKSSATTTTAPSGSTTTTAPGSTTTTAPATTTTSS